ncbi:hypothetical protein Tco_0008676 [Tanacetum coccineum]
MAATGPGNVVSRRVTDDLIVFSGETAVPKYMKFFLVQKTTSIIAELQAIEDQDEVHDSLLAAKDAKRSEESKLVALHEVIAKALEEIKSQGNNVEILDGVDLHNDMRLCPYGGRVLEMNKSLQNLVTAVTKGKGFLTMVALYILDKLSEVANSSRLEDKIKVMFSRARDSDESFIDLLRDLCSAIRVSITKDRRLIAELEALGQHADVLKPLQYMGEMVAWDSARVGVLEQLLAGTHVGMRLKAEYATNMGETV